MHPQLLSLAMSSQHLSLAMASLHLSLLLSLAACTSAGPQHQDVARNDHKELAHPTEDMIRDLVTISEAVLQEYGVDKFTLR